MGRDHFHLRLEILTDVADFRRVHPRGLHRIHDCNWTLWLVTEGEGWLGLGAERRRVSAKQAVLFAPGTPLDAGVSDCGAWTYRWVAFRAHPRLTSLLDWPTEASGVGLLRVDDAKVWEQASTALDELHNLSRCFSPPKRTLLCLNLLERALLWLEAANPDAHPPAEDRRMLAVTRYMAENYQRKVTVAELAQVCHLSASRFAHVFRQIMGRPPMQYLEALRLEHARRLLLGTDDTVAQVAAACGFCNEFHFSHIFKRRTGSSPTQLRRRGRA